MASQTQTLRRSIFSQSDLAPTTPPASRNARTVVNCYDFFDKVFPNCGLIDFTEGMYFGNPATPYEQAQRNQVNWLLDQVGCKRGTRLLDIGCGNGRLLEMAEKRGAKATGITISPDQVARCKQRGLDARLMNYRTIPLDWTGRFDAIVANGSIEHFVAPEEAIAGKQDSVYQQLFTIAAKLLNPRLPTARMATTVIHSNEYTPRIEPQEILKSPWRFRWFSPKFHYALLQRGFGGFYPAPKQLESCAQGRFELTSEIDGTLDYHWTSEQWFQRVREHLMSPRMGPRIWMKLAQFFACHPLQAVNLTTCLLIAESWQRQFRGPHAPTTLLRQTWLRKGA